MTTIAAVARDNHIVMGSDSETSVYDRPITPSASKIRRFTTDSGHQVLIGTCGNGAIKALLSIHLTLEQATDLDDHQALQSWADRVALQVTKIAVDHGIVRDGHMDGNSLLAAYGQLWTISDHVAVPHADGVATLGSGEGPAIGALDAFLAQGVEPEQAVEYAVGIACRRDQYSGLPVVIETL